MKSTTQTATTTKTNPSRGLKSASRKTKVAIKRGSRTARKSANATQATPSGYSDTAQRLLKRGKSAFGEAYTWAGKTGKSLPDNVRSLGMPDQKSIQTFMSDSPLVMGAVGLGIGVMIGTMIPSMGAAKYSTAKSSRRR